MVSKVAVIALVAIVACPILLGYALNLEEVSISDYKTNGDTVNVTPLLQDGVGYSYANADIYNLNTLFNSGTTYMPLYKTFGYTKTPLRMSQELMTGSTHPVNTFNLSDYKYLSYIADYDNPDGTNYLAVTFGFNDSSPNTTITMLHSMFYEADTGKMYYTTYYQVNGVWMISSPALLSNWQHLSTYKLTHYGAFSAHTQNNFIYAGSPAYAITYVNISDGFYLNKYNIDPSIGYGGSEASLPQHTKNILFTIDLSTITASSHHFNIYTSNSGASDFITIKKTTDAEGEHWAAYYDKSGLGLTEARYLITDLYYDSSKSSNTYQIYMSNTEGIDFKYVGDWPSFIGVSNYYQNYHYDWHYGNHDDIALGIDYETPLMRIDGAEYRAFEYPIIENETYDPSQFRLKPSTTISNVSMYGESITFGGNTYNVSKDKIQLGSQHIPVEGLVLTSVPSENGGYDNMIGKTIISNTPQPSTIVFNGTWSASISTESNSETTYTKTEWTPGQFGWNGIDQNFLMVGLLTSIGVFIALGIYIRRTGASLWPLLLVCGGAVVLFFTML